jgi:pimeloyl-ACP methyl ester carboxylesterase
MIQSAVIINHKKIIYSRTGEGVPLVLVHGFGEDGSVWKNQFNAIDGFNVIVPHLPGSGSDMIADMSMEGQATWLHDFLVHLQIDACIMIGHSMGGYITLAFAEAYGSMLRAFGFCHSSAYADKEEKKETRRKGIEFIRAHGAWEFLKTSTPNLYSPASRSGKQAMIEEHINLCKKFTDDALIAYYEAMINRPDRTRVLKEAQVPVLFIMGKEDAVVPLEDALKQSHLPQEAHIFILAESGHMGMVEEPEKTSQYIRSFLKAIDL